MPNWVIALVAAGGLAAALSTAAGLLLAISSAISHDLIKGIFRPTISEKAELNTSRIAMSFTVLLAGVFRIQPSRLCGWDSRARLWAGSLFDLPALMLGIFYKRMNTAGAVAGMLSGIGITLFYVFQHKGVMFVQSTSFLGNMSPNWFMGIEPNAFGAVGALVNFIVAIIVCKLTAEPPKEVQDLVDFIRAPHETSDAASR